MKLAGKVALVTGASRGIGRAVAERFAVEGAPLFLTCRTRGDELNETVRHCSEAGVEVQSAVLDLTGQGAADSLVAAVIERFGRLDILVHCAAVSKEDLLVMAEDGGIREMIDTNIMALVALTRASVRAMLRRRSGVIVQLSSVTASRPGRGGSVYAGTKGFVESFTKAVAAEVGRKGIRVNAIAPGVIETDMNAALRAAAGPEVLKRIAQQRFGAPADVAAAAAWLASDDAAYVNGAVIAVDGGFGLGV